MMMKLNCWEIWLMGIIRLRFRVRKEASRPRVKPPKPLMASTPPTTAQMT